MKPQMHKVELQQKNRLGTDNRISTGEGRGWKLVKLVRNLAFDAVPNNNVQKYIFGPQRGPLPHHWNFPVKNIYIVYNKKHCHETNQRAQWQSDARTQENP